LSGFESCPALLSDIIAAGFLANACHNPLMEIPLARKVSSRLNGAVTNSF
jgi:hypothetical protein